METTDGNTSPAGRLESANGSSSATDLAGLSLSERIDLAQTLIERAQDRLRYGRRQEAEEAICFLTEAREVIASLEVIPIGEG